MLLSKSYNAFDPKDKVALAQEIDTAVMNESFWAPMIGKNQNAIIRTFKTEAAGAMTVKLRDLLRGAGVKNNADFDTNQAKLQYLSQTVFVEIFGHSVRSEDLRFEQYKNNIDFTADASDALQEWMTDSYDRKVFATGVNDSTNVFALSVTDGVQDKAANGSIDDLCAQVTADDIVTVQSVRAMIKRASIGIDHNGKKVPPVRPFAVKATVRDGVPIKQRCYVIVLDTFGIAQLKDDPEYNRGVIDGSIRGSDNPFFTGQVCSIDGSIILDGGVNSDEYAGVLSSDDDHSIFLNEHIPAVSLGQYAGASGLTTSLGMLLGATAFACPLSTDATLYPEDKDMGRKKAIGIDRLLSIAKARYVGVKPEEQKTIWHNKDLSIMTLVYARV